MSGDQGADLIAIKNGVRYAIQAKNYSDKVSNKSVQGIVASLKYYGAEEAMVVTNNYFTDSAKELAARNQVRLIDRDKLIAWMANFPVEK